MFPTKAKMAAFVCSGRRRPKVRNSARLSWWKLSCRAMNTPASMATTPKMIEASMNWRTTLSLNSMGTLVADVLVMGIGSGEIHGGRACSIIERQQRHLLQAAAPFLQALRQKQRRK